MKYFVVVAVVASAALAMFLLGRFSGAGGTPSAIDSAANNSGEKGGLSPPLRNGVSGKIGESTERAAQAAVGIANRQGKFALGAAVDRLIAGSASAAVAATSMKSLDPVAAAYGIAVLGDICSAERRSAPRVSINDRSSKRSGVDSQSSMARQTIDARHPSVFCADQQVMDPTAVAAAWADAARFGDPRARAYLWWQDFEKTFGATKSETGEAVQQSDASLKSPESWINEGVRTLVAALATGDPLAISGFGERLQATANENALVLANGGEWLAELPQQTWELVACGFGGRCSGDDNPSILFACATRGQCAASLDEHLRKYVWTGDQAAAYDAVAERLAQLVTTGNSELLQVRSRKPSGIPAPFIIPVPRRYR